MDGLTNCQRLQTLRLGARLKNAWAASSPLPFLAPVSRAGLGLSRAPCVGLGCGFTSGEEKP